MQRIRKKITIYKFLPIDVHEIENLIPTNFIDMLNIWNTDACRQNKEYFDYLKNDAERILPFFDFKKGIRKTNDLKMILLTTIMQNIVIIKIHDIMK